MDDQSNQLNANTADLNMIIRTATHHIFYLAKEKLFKSDPQEDIPDDTELSQLLRFVASVLVRSGGETVAISTMGDVVNGEGSSSGPPAVDDEKEKDEIIYVDDNGRDERSREDTIRPPLVSTSIDNAILSGIGKTSFPDHVQMVQVLIEIIRRAKDGDAKNNLTSLFKRYILLSSLDKHSARLHDAQQLLRRLQENNLGDQIAWDIPNAKLNATSYAEFLQDCRSSVDDILVKVDSLKTFIKMHKSDRHQCQTIGVSMKKGQPGNGCVKTALDSTHDLIMHLQRLERCISGESQHAASRHQLLRVFLNVGRAEESRSGDVYSEDDDKDAVRTTRFDREQTGAKNLTILLRCSQHMKACSAIAKAVHRKPDDSLVTKLTLQALRILKTGEEERSLVPWSQFYGILRTKATTFQLQKINDLEKLIGTSKLDVNYLAPTCISRTHCEASVIAAALKRNQASQGETPDRKPHLELGVSRRCCLQCNAVLEATSEFEAAPFTISKSSVSHRIWHANPPPDLPLDIQRAVKNKLINTLLTGLDSIAIEAALKATRRRDSLTSQDNQSLTARG